MSESTAVKIESQDLSIEDLYKDFYTVPDFQREYVWNREQVEKMFEDICDEFFDEDGQLIKGPEYFLGSIVVCESSDKSNFSLIDGQQRMTTIYLALCVMRDVMREIGETPNNTLMNQIQDHSTDENGEESYNQRLVLQYDDSCGILKAVVNKPNDLDNIARNTISVQRIVSAYADIKDFLLSNFGDNPKKLKQFYATFTKHVKLIRIKTPSLSNALKVFETINDRGVGLNAMDLLKNLLFMKATSDEHSTLKVRWKQLVDTLDECYEKPLRFLRYFIMSHFEIDSSRPLREDDIYDWISSHSQECGIDKQPLTFLDILIECAHAWKNFYYSSDVNGLKNPYLKNLTYLSGAAKQHYILLLAGRHLPNDLFTELCRNIENLFFTYIITRESTKTFERNFTRWSRELRSVKDKDELDAFLNSRFKPDMANRASAFSFSLEQLNQNRIQQYRMKYILAKLTQYVEKQAWGNSAHAFLDQYVESSVEVEHILPLNPKPEVLNAFDKIEEYDEYKIRLGNLCLLEKTINSSISNGSLDEKLPGYEQSSFLLTKSLNKLPSVGSDTSLNRAVANLKSFTTWHSVDIEDRQLRLVELAKLTWDIPEITKDNDRTGNE